jgi:hypothetical protein
MPTSATASARRVVDSSANHDYGSELGTRSKRADNVELPFGRLFGVDTVDRKGRSDSLCNRGTVAGNQSDVTNRVGPEAINEVVRIGPQAVGHHDGTGYVAIDANEDPRPAGRDNRIESARRFLGTGVPTFTEPARTAHSHAPAGHASLDSLAGTLFHAFGSSQRKPRAIAS